MNQTPLLDGRRLYALPRCLNAIDQSCSTHSETTLTGVCQLLVVPSFSCVRAELEEPNLFFYWTNEGPNILQSLQTTVINDLRTYVRRFVNKKFRAGSNLKNIESKIFSSLQEVESKSLNQS